MNWITVAIASTIRALLLFFSKSWALVNSPNDILKQKQGRVSKGRQKEDPLQKRNGNEGQNADGNEREQTISEKRNQLMSQRGTSDLQRFAPS